ncbi:hypothetical protein HYFRA_00013325 [Hymenoscyphus fraxineus]|uniref:Uncharacterized protein n=1 Tax=Hymenoscyphus fraxineus TaxID=746836 RepID=A0A9N9LBC1_9HELO|nr:hypothetical protein HYFRA_00013325 [Hymenoscyphus fraxineus]
MRGHAPLDDPQVILIAFRLKFALSRNLGIAKELDASTRALVSQITYGNTCLENQPIAPPATKKELKKDLKTLGSIAYCSLQAMACYNRDKARKEQRIKERQEKEQKDKYA